MRKIKRASLFSGIGGSAAAAQCFAWFVWIKGWKGDTTVKWI